MQAIILSHKSVNTKNGLFIVSQVRLDTNEEVYIWNKPRTENCISNIGLGELIEVIKSKSGYYSWMPGALVGIAKKKAIAEYRDKQIKFLVGLHQLVEVAFIDAQPSLSIEVLSRYTEVLFSQINKKFDL